MATGTGMADASNAAFVVAIVAYAVAMFGYAVEYAFGRRTAKQQASPQLAPATTSSGTSEWTVPDGHAAHVPGSPETDYERDQDRNEAADSSGINPRQALIAGRVAITAMVLGALAHAATLGARAAAVGRWPWGNMYEFIVAACLVGVIVWLVLVAKRLVARRLSLFVMLAMVLMLGLSTRVYTEAAPLVPALDSYWIAIHVFAAIIASGIFMVGFIVAVLHLLRRRFHQLSERGATIRFPFTIAPRLPLADKLEKLTWRLHVLAFPLWTFAVIAGAIWAREAWSRYWGWDPKEVWAFIAWVVYAAYLHSRATGSTGRKLAPWIAVLGWAVMLFNLFGVNLVMDGLHSYSGV